MASSKKVRSKNNHRTQRTPKATASYAPYTALDFTEIESHAFSFADHIEKNFEAIADILLTYESFEVVKDETDRTLDLLRNLEENKKYFELRVGEIAAFLPRNQPLYALTCFVLIPSYMGSEVHFRIPHSMRYFMSQLLELLNIEKFYPNVHVSALERLEFLRERSAVRVNETSASLPVTDAVIFTGTPAHADQLRLVFDQRTLFIANGAGHNPVVVSKDANIERAVEAVLTLQLYNQGQDCAAPKAVLVHADVLERFLSLLRDGLRIVKIGAYSDRSVRVGPISDPFDLVRIQEFLIRHRAWLDSTTPGIFRTSESILEPTIIVKPLREGGNFTELFAPVVVVQAYSKEADLDLYFKNSRYATNAMYVTVYGTCRYVSKLVGKKINGLVLHDLRSYLHNTHLHAPGVERGTKPYGGNGYGASSLTIRDQTICTATLPQREISEYLAKPLLHASGLDAFRERLPLYTKIEVRNVERILRLSSHEKHEDKRNEGSIEYVDTQALHADSAKRYALIDKKFTYRLLEKPNAEYIARLSPTQQEEIRALRQLLTRRDDLSLEEFTALLYALPHKPDPVQPNKRVRQRNYFQNIYELLFGKKSGPNLPQFLKDVDSTITESLLDV